MNEVVRIVISGAESTGKTWLAQRLAAHFDEPWAVEHAREYWDAKGGIDVTDLQRLGLGQVANEENAAARARRVVFFDTDLITCTIWNDLLFPGACPEWMRLEAERRARRVGLYLLCEADVPFAPDPQRCFPEPADRSRVARICREAIESRGLPFELISGEWLERERRAIRAVEALLPRTPRGRAGGVRVLGRGSRRVRRS